MKDGHIHTPYCPHGTDDKFEQYVEKAIKVGLDEISFTEHFPLPKGFTDPAPNNDSSINLEQLKSYINDVNKLKDRYKDKIKINVGAEVDYVEGFEKEIKSLLDEYGKYLEDGILSVHMIKIEDEYYCMDFSSEEFEKIVNLLSEKEYELDYNVAGLFKEDCGEVYISGYLAELIKKYNVKVVLGSDSHSSKFIDKYKINI